MDENTGRWPDVNPRRRPEDIGRSSTTLRTVWDVPTRLIHWALVLLIPFLWWSHKTDHLDWHKRAGFAVAALLTFRLYLGFFGAATSRFSHFLRGPRAVGRYLRGDGERKVGHNPLGGWGVIVMLGLLATQVGLGLFASDEDGLAAGPLANYVTSDQSRLASNLHALAFEGLLVLIGLHIAAVTVHLIAGRNLIAPMLTGRAALTGEDDAPRTAGPVALAFGFALAGATFVILWWLDAT